MKKSLFILLICSISVFFSFVVNSAQMPSNISPQQIEQFKRLPEAQQRALAQSMGVDFNNIKNLLSLPESKSDKNTQDNTIYPRGTIFDEKGIPTLTDEGLNEAGGDQLKPFGYDVFANAPYTFAPSMDIVVPEDHIISSGDIISVQLFGKENDHYELTISRQGQIVIPKLGPYQVAGITYHDLTQLIREKVQERIIGTDAVISLSQLSSIRVFVAGEAYKPGPYVMNSLSSITHALFAAGGINESGSLRNIQLKRAGKLVGTFDVYDLLIYGDSSGDLQLRSGDVLFIPAKNYEVTVDGSVRRPAIYELKNNETFIDAIEMAGGLLAEAYSESISVQRYQKGLKRVVSVDLTDANQQSQAVKNGDYLHVMKNSEMFTDSVTLIGAVTRPGKYQWQPGQKISDLIKSVEMSLLPYADLNYGLIVREVGIARKIKVLQFSIANALEEPGSFENLTLDSRDQILIFSSANTLDDEVMTLDKLAFDQETLAANEKQQAKDKYKERLFWHKYGKNSPLKFNEPTDEEAQKIANSTLNDLSNESDEELEVDVKQLGLFSRQRLLAPIITKLKAQSAGGEQLKLVEIDGQVRFPGIYPLPDNSNIKSLISAAGGLTESAYLAKADISRSLKDNYKSAKKSFSIDLAKELSTEESNLLKLESKDRLYIHQIPAWSDNHIIELKGEFVFPGKYTIERGETLIDIITKAGGLTEYAYLDGAVFTREKLKELELENIQKLASDLRIDMASKSLTESDTNFSYEEAQSLLADLVDLKPIGRLIIELPRMLKDISYNVSVEDGDVLYIPTKKNSINVVGQVQVTTSHIFDKKLDANDYIAKSGGIKKRADEERIYVIKANGTTELVNNQNSWFSDADGEGMKPGDTIVVPLDSGYMTNLTLWSSATQIIYNTAVALAAINGL